MFSLKNETLEALVSHYQTYRLPDYNCEMQQHHKDELDLKAAIILAASCKTAKGNRHSHQYRIPEDTLSYASDALLECSAEIENASDFDALFDCVSAAIKPIVGIGPLTIYDIALRIGKFKKLNLEPKRVYLHAGATVGAKVLGLTGAKLEDSAFPKPMRQLPPANIEDFLCIYKDALRSEEAAEKMLNSHKRISKLGQPHPKFGC